MPRTLQDDRLRVVRSAADTMSGVTTTSGLHTTRTELESLLEFERLVGELFARFVNLHADEVDEAIEETQRRLATALDVDRSAIFQVTPTGDLTLTHHWGRGEERLFVTVSARETFPWSFERILRGETLVLSSVDEMPDEVERASLRRFNTKSRVSIPLSISGRIVGAVSFAATRAERQWSEETLGRLHLVAKVFSNALSRRNADRALAESESRFRRMSDEAPVLIWLSDRDKRCTWCNRRYLEFVGRTLEHEVGDGWTAGIHPDDLPMCLSTYEAAFDSRQPFTMEFRVRRHDGEWRSVVNHALPTYDGNGEFSGYVGSCLDITEQKDSKVKLETALAEVRSLRDQLQVENTYLRREVQERSGQGPVIGQSEVVRCVLDQIAQVAGTDSTVLLLGETGTGKELFAAQIHERSGRRGRTMVRVNCAAIPATLIESELFGREKGAFTGALARQVGRFELADRSTIFLDEIGDLPPEVQVKLLRVLEERQIERLGSPRSIPIDTRIVAATHRDLERLIAEGKFREDLYYRLNVFPIHVPPLRDRAEDIPLLVWRFVEEFAKTFGKQIETIGKDSLAALQSYSWPGNIRELRNVVERAMITASGPRLTIPVPLSTAAAAKRSAKLVDVERSHIRGVLESTNWRVRGPGGAADRLGLKPTTLETRLAKLGLKRPLPQH